MNVLNHDNEIFIYADNDIPNMTDDLEKLIAELREACKKAEKEINEIVRKMKEEFEKATMKK